MTNPFSARDQRWTRAQAWLGKSVDVIDTPALVLDLDALERNLDAMAAFARQAGVKLRPHAKMHKSADIARLQLVRGAVGFCVQKTSEAEALAAQGITDLYISNEVIAPDKLARVAALALRLHQAGGRLAIAVDSALGVARLVSAMNTVSAVEALKALAATGAPHTAGLMDVFVELDVGQGRCGVAHPAEVVPLAQAVASQPTLRFAGIQAYHGGAQHLRSAEARREAIAAAAARVRAAQAELATAGIACPLVTGAGTGTFEHEATSGLWGELQAGSYAVLDRDYADNLTADTDTDAAERSAASAPLPRFEHALFVKCRVVSRCATHVVVDAGHKSHAIDSGLPGVRHQLRGQPQYAGAWVVANGGDEHTKLLPAPSDPNLRSTQHSHKSGLPLPDLGDTVWLIPGHCDPTVNLHDWFVGVRSGLKGGLEAGTVECLWPVHARGCVD